MTDNLKLWDQFADIDPQHTKQITGKPYKGTSPKPQYVIKCLTEMFGPVGVGFGWDVVAEDFKEMGGETIHWLRIKFWHTDRSNTFDSYGQTKAAYVTNSNKQIVDEDAPKKSLTDAIVKAASQVGIAANIFLGRWDDSQYVAEVEKKFREEEKPAPTVEQKRDWVLASMKVAKTPDAVANWWGGEKISALVKSLPNEMQHELQKAYNETFELLEAA